MIEVLGTVISYVFQISVILFVLKEFGIVSSPFAKKVEASEGGGQPAGGGNVGGIDFGGLMQGLMKGIQEQGKPVKKGKKRAVEVEPGVQIAEVE